MRSSVSTFADIKRLSLANSNDMHIFISYESDLGYRTLHSSSGHAQSVTTPFHCSSRVVTYTRVYRSKASRVWPSTILITTSLRNLKQASDINWITLTRLCNVTN
jgi:hypothetical protein